MAKILVRKKRSIMQKKAQAAEEKRFVLVDYNIECEEFTKQNISFLLDSKLTRKGN